MTKEGALAPQDPSIPVAIAWDNCDADATAKYESATHNGQIAAVVSVLKVKPCESMRLSSPSSWAPASNITFEHIMRGLPRDKHWDTLHAFSDALLDCIADSRSYLREEGEGRSCLEAELRKRLAAQPVEMDTKLVFVMAGTTKQESDCEDALDRIVRIAHARSLRRSGCCRG